MKKYRFTFTGRQSGAIGILYKITDTYHCKDVHEALSYLWMDYERITGLTIYEGSKVIEQPDKINFVKVRPYTERERSPVTGSYRYTRSDAPPDYKF